VGATYVLSINTLINGLEAGSGDGGGGSGTGSKPGTLATTATYSEAVAKLDAIIAYCNSNPGTTNDGIKAQAQSLKTSISVYESYWSSVGATYVLSINTLINGLEAGSGGGGTTDGVPKSIFITGLTGISGRVEIAVFADQNNSYPMVAEGEGIISGGTVMLQLKDSYSKNWTGTGPHFIQMGIVVTEGKNDLYALFYLYTGGLTLNQLGITGTIMDNIAKLPKYNIFSAESTIPIQMFLDVTNQAGYND
jgi:hypothetical protein